MKVSKFNIFWEENGIYYCSNTFSKALIKLDKFHYDILSNNDENELYKIDQDIDLLKKEGIILDDGINELNLLRFSREKSKGSTDEIEVVVAPTLSCNFKCVYCFEMQRKGTMDEKTQDALVKYIEKKIIELKIKKIRFIWFGGEPLLCMDIIESVSKRLNNVCHNHTVKIEYSIISNGYLVNDDILNRLMNVNIHHMQITLDGDKKTHDLRRMTHDGSGTYDVIINNLSYFTGKDFTVAVRVNIDRENIASFVKVKKIISDIGNSKIACHPALIEKTENQTCEQQNRCLHGNESWFYEDEEIRQYYINSSREYLNNISCVCDAEHYNSAVIDEKGNIYKCWNSIGYDNEIWGSIFTEKDIPGNPIVASGYLGRDPYSEEECIDCPYIPICAGGCIYHNLHSNHPKCTPAKFLYKELINNQGRREN